MSMPDIDWNEVWRSIQAKKHENGPRDPKLWDKRAAEFTRAVAGSEYVTQFLHILKPEPDWTVLDMGSAAGTLAVPLARLVRSVTAVDPSERMRELLRERCENEGLKNIRVVEGRWQDDWERLGLAPHDVAVASRSLLVDDLAEALRKLDAYSTRKAILTTLVDDGPHDRRIIEAVGRTFHPGPDYVVVYNLLRQIGVLANVAFARINEDRTFADLDEAVATSRWMIRGVTEEEEARLKRHLETTLVRDGDRLRLPYSRVTRWAVIWWDKEAGDGPVA